MANTRVHSELMGSIPATQLSGQIPTTQLGSGSVVQYLRTQYTPYTSTNTYWNAIQDVALSSSGGAQLMNQTITPKATTNLLVVHAAATTSCSQPFYACLGLFRDAASACFAMQLTTPEVAGYQYPLDVWGAVTAGSLAATDFRVRVGNGSNGGYTTYINGYGGTRYGGGTMATFLEIWEIAA